MYVHVQLYNVVHMYVELVTFIFKSVYVIIICFLRSIVSKNTLNNFSNVFLVYFRFLWRQKFTKNTFENSYLKMNFREVTADLIIFFIQFFFLN